MASYDLAAAVRGKHLFVAGGSSGINLGIADVFARCGAKVSLCSRKADRVTAAVNSLKAHGGEAWGAAADVRDYAQVETALKGAKDALGPIDVLISGAAGNFVAPALGMSSNAFRTVIEIDLIGTFNVARAGFEFLRKPGASFIAISAPQALHPYSYQSHVNAAKAGIDMLTKTLAVEWGPLGVRCNAIIPGPIGDTEGMARLAPTEAEQKLAREGTPLQRYGTKDEVGYAALFLASPLAEYITGAILPVDGGAVLPGPGRLGDAMKSAYEKAAPRNR
ncbi:MAG: SDR family oxidoreductase [Rhodospirillaceae bacterium]|nr:SDR family oxidoreductase [Rhodospirillaceae bacterium]